jgi:hypothetical protein
MAEPFPRSSKSKSKSTRPNTPRTRVRGVLAPSTSASTRWSCFQFDDFIVEVIVRAPDGRRWQILLEGDPTLFSAYLVEDDDAEGGNAR